MIDAVVNELARSNGQRVKGPNPRSADGGSDDSYLTPFGDPISSADISNSYVSIAR